MKLIVGLGNPGKEYAQTRHNLGFMVLDQLTSNFKLDKKLEAEIAKDGEIIYAKPMTYMNESGRSVQKICRYYKIKPGEILVVHDDKDLVFGKIRWRAEGSAGGHNGLASIIQALSTEKFPRLKLGIAQAQIKNTVDFVLGKFSWRERRKLKKFMAEALEKIAK